MIDIKRIKRTLLYSLLLFFLPLNGVKAATNPYTEITSWGTTNCTWMAWQQTYNRTGIALPGFGNAREWYNDAKNAGFAVGSEARANSIIVLDNYQEYGHVAYVDHVTDGKVYVWDSSKCYREMTQEEHDAWWSCIINNTTNEQDEYLCDYLKVIEETTCEYSYENGKLTNVIGYIYVTEPRTTTSSSSSIDTTPSSSATSSVSNNSYLKELQIEGIDFTFDKEVLEYNLEVEYEVTKIKFTALPEDEKSTIVMEEEVSLEVGNNTFKVTVIAEDESSTEYNININRLEKVEDTVESNDTDSKNDKVEKKKNSKKIIIWVIIGSIVVIGIVISIVVWYKVKKKKSIKCD